VRFDGVAVDLFRQDREVVIVAEAIRQLRCTPVALVEES
jgi:hypothetical protein